MTKRSPHGRLETGASPAVADPEILRRLAGGDSSALGELYDHHCHSIRRFLAQVTANAEDVDDLTHATFLAAAEIAGRYDGRPSCRPWLIGIAAQLLRRRKRRFGRFRAFLSSLGGAQTASADPAPGWEARTDIGRALRAISEPKRVTFLLAEVEGLTCPEIAAALGIPVGTVWTRLHAARRELRRALEGGSEP
jgi:RNA polymerase sigma-70 factor (ECF subfamily)